MLEVLILLSLLVLTAIASAGDMSDPSKTEEWSRRFFCGLIPIGIVALALHLQEFSKIVSAPYTSDYYMWNFPLQLLLALGLFIALPFYSIVLLVLAVIGFGSFIAMLDYAFRKHPVEEHVVPALREDLPIDTTAAARALQKAVYDAQARPLYQINNDILKVRKMRESAREHTGLADDILQRERELARRRDRSK